MRSILSLFAVAAVLTVAACQKEGRGEAAAEVAVVTPQAALAQKVAAGVQPSPDPTAAAPAAGAVPAEHDEMCGGGECAKGGACGGGGGSCCGGMGEAATPGAMAAVPDDAVWTELQVTGMRCGACARRIERSVGAIAGVVAVTADHATGKVRIASAEGARDVRGEIGPQIDALGYHVVR